MEVSISRALVELKTLGSRIDKLIVDFTPVDMIINGKLKSGKNRDEFIAESKSVFQKICDLISYRDKIKSEIVKSNAQTTVLINSVEMTVAQAIEKKTSIVHEKTLLQNLRMRLSKYRQLIEQNNQLAQDRLDRLLETTFSKDSSKVKSDELESVAKPFMLRNEATLLDPLGLEKIVLELDEKITSFESEVDIILSESNARTVINI
jgi:hypothetical protein